jgi:hypothetical protein
MNRRLASMNPAGASLDGHRVDSAPGSTAIHRCAAFVGRDCGLIEDRGPLIECSAHAHGMIA